MESNKYLQTANSKIIQWEEKIKSEKLSKEEKLKIQKKMAA